MKINKANFSNSESRINLSFPITKVDKEKRTVSGFATLDNIDRHGDVVTSEASEKAFARFRGNLREMHAPVAVGKVVSFHPEDFFDKESGITYKGIYVNAYVSKGAQDTWEKVLDGTMTGFSIGGNIVQSSFEPGDAESDKERRIIKEYDLMELSLVDSPANPLASILSIQKLSDGTTFFKGMAADTNIENVFWCSHDQIASTTKSDTKDCVICGSRMNSIGWIESSETEKAYSIQKVIDSYLKKDDAPGPDHAATTKEGDAGVVDSNKTINLYPDQNPNEKFLFNDGTKINKSDADASLSKGGNKMTDETNTPSDEVVETPAETVEAAEAPAAEAPAEEASEDAVEKSVTLADSTESFAKMLTDLQNLFGEAINKNSADVDSKLQKSVDSVESARSEMTNAVEDIKKELMGLTNHIADFFKRVESLEKRFESYESDTAVKKSIGEVENSPRDTKIQKSIWQGSFLGVQNL
jgi:phage shock protein A